MGFTVSGFVRCPRMALWDVDAVRLWFTGGQARETGIPTLTLCTSRLKQSSRAGSVTLAVVHKYSFELTGNALGWRAQLQRLDSGFFLNGPFSRGPSRPRPFTPNGYGGNTGPANSTPNWHWEAPSARLRVTSWVWRAGLRHEASANGPSPRRTPFASPVHGGSGRKPAAASPDWQRTAVIFFDFFSKSKSLVAARRPTVDLRPRTVYARVVPLLSVVGTARRRVCSLVPVAGCRRRQYTLPLCQAFAGV